jgi:hypothetical protein
MATSEHAELIRQLRAIPAAAPDTLRERVHALGEPPAGRGWPSLPSRRVFLVLAPACVVALLAAAAIHGLVNSGQKEQQLTFVRHGESGAKLAPHALTSTTSVYGSADTGAPALRSPIVPPSPGRHQNYDAFMTLRVKDLDALTDRTNDAMRIVRSYGGYVASVHQSTPVGQPGQADLVLRVPIGRVEPALVQLSDLGTVLDRELSIVDLEQALRQQQQRIMRLKLFIARAVEQLEQELPADVRLRLELQLQQARANLNSATRTRKATLDEAAFARLSLSLTTQKTAEPVKKGGMGRIERAARDAGSFLAGAGAVVLFLLIVLSPVIVLGVGSLVALRAYRRREERRLLAT